MTNLAKSKENICPSSPLSFSNCYWETKINSCLVMFGTGATLCGGLEKITSLITVRIYHKLYVAAIPHIHKRTESRDSSRYLNTTVHYVQDVLGINSNQKGGKDQSVQQEISGVDRRNVVYTQ